MAVGARGRPARVWLADSERVLAGGLSLSS